MSAMSEIEDILKKFGKTEEETQILICRFLEEEAFKYVEFSKLFNRIYE